MSKHIKKLNEIIYKVKENCYETLSYEVRQYNYIPEIIETVIEDFLSKEKALKADNITKEVINISNRKYKEHLKIENEQKKKALKLYNITKGKIPCINQCGYTRQQTKEETLESSNTFLCPACCKEADEKGNIWDLFKKDIYETMGVK
jgi:hypothetical protein